MIQADHTARIIYQSWRNGDTLQPLNEDIRPKTPEEGYAIQAELEKLGDEPVVGWKIAATSKAGRRHIQVDRPLAGRLYPSMVFADGAHIPMLYNRMKVAEAEIVLSLKSDLAPLIKHRTEQEVATAVGSMHAGIEFPDSRFEDFTMVGTACLIADNACAKHFVLGPAVTPPSDLEELASLPTQLHINNKLVTSGVGSDALGGSLTSLTWLVNTVNELGITVKAGEFITTGVTGLPSPIHPGDQLEVHLGSLTSVRATASL